MTCPVDCPLYKENQQLRARKIELEEIIETLKESIRESIVAVKDKHFLKKQ